MAIDINTFKSAPVQQPVVTKPTETNQKPDSKMGTTTKVVIGTGLAALAAVGIYIATKGKGGAKNVENVVHSTQTANPNPKSELLEQIKQLKTSIKENYLTQKKQKMDDLFQHSNICQGRAIQGSKQKAEEINSCKKTMERSKPTIDEFSTNVRNKLTELSKDSDWIECRKLRKQICKETGNNDYKNASKLYLINAVIDAKASGHSLLLDRAGISIGDAMKVIKDSSATNESVHKFISKNKSLNGFMDLGTNPLRLKIFPGYESAKSEYSYYMSSKNGIDMINAACNSKHKILSDLANETRQSADVKKLKELTSQLKSQQNG